MSTSTAPSHGRNVRADTRTRPALNGLKALLTRLPCSDISLRRRQTIDPTRVLIVDADCVQCANTGLLVHIIGSFETRLAYSPAAALTMAGDFLPGIVLISTDLPELTGYALASALRRCLGAHPARLIALTSEIAAADRGRALAAGFEQYLILPVQQPALERILMPKLRRHLQRFRASPARDAR